MLKFTGISIGRRQTHQCSCGSLVLTLLPEGIAGMHQSSSRHFDTQRNSRNGKWRSRLEAEERRRGGTDLIMGRALLRKSALF